MTVFLARWPRLRGLIAVSAIFAMMQASIVPAFAQRPDEPPPQAERVYDMRELERLVAPIALYPDDLLTHVLMAATYPFDVVLAERWRSRNARLKGNSLQEALEDQTWDASVKAVTAFPQVLTMMSEKLEWTQELGEAFLAQPDDVFAAVQTLRARAETAGNLTSTKEFRVRRDSDGPRTIYIIEPAEPTVVYVPVYDPLVVYGTWAYPDYPPYYWYPRTWRPGPVFWFGTAIVTSAALWAYWDWRRRSVIVRPTPYNAFLRTKVASPTWAFNPVKRKGVAFKAPVLAKKFGPIPPPTRIQKRVLDQRLKTLPKTLPPGAKTLPKTFPKAGPSPSTVPPITKAPLTKAPLATSPPPTKAPKGATPKGTLKTIPKTIPKATPKSGTPSKAITKSPASVPQIKKVAPKFAPPSSSSKSGGGASSGSSTRTLKKAVPAPRAAPVGKAPANVPAKKAAPAAKVLKKQE